VACGPPEHIADHPDQSYGSISRQALAKADKKIMNQTPRHYDKHLDFSDRRVLVVGGSSGIGNGIAQAFRSQGAAVEVWGTRSSASDYEGEEGSSLEGLSYRCVDLSLPESDSKRADLSLQAHRRLDVLVLCQGIVRYQRAEFEMPGFREVIEVNLMSLMRCAKRKL